MDDVQEMSEVIDDEMCSESCQDSDVDGSEFPGCKGSVLIKLLSFCGIEDKNNIKLLNFYLKNAPL